MTELPGQVFQSEEIPRPYAHFLIRPLKRHPGLTLQVSQSHDGDWALFSATWTLAAGKKILLQPTHGSLQNVYLQQELGTIYILCAWCFPACLSVHHVHVVHPQGRRESCIFWDWSDRC